jgi:hypothetical protein
VVGDILGTGSYALVGEVALRAGGAIWTSFLAAFVLGAILFFVNRAASR